MLQLLTTPLFVSATESILEGVPMMAPVDMSIIIRYVKSKLIKMTRAWNTDKIWVPTGMEPVTSRTPGERSIHWVTRTHGEHGHLTEFMCDRHAAYCYDQHCRSHPECGKWIKVVNFKLGDEMWKVNSSSN